MATKQAHRYKSLNILIKKYIGTYISTNSDKAELFKTHLFHTFQPYDKIINYYTVNSVNQFLNTPLPHLLLSKYFSSNNVKYILQKYPNQKSPGYDFITDEFSKKKYIIHFTHFYYAILRLSCFATVWKFSSIIRFPKLNTPPDLERLTDL